MTKNLHAAVLTAIGLSAGFASAAPLTNLGFESGLTGWTTIGSVSADPSTSVTTFDSTVWSIIAAETLMGHLDSNPTAVATIEATLGLAPGSLDALNINPDGGTLTDGSAIYQDFTGSVGDVIGEWWNYVARDYVPFNDPAYAIVLNLDTGIAESIDVLASIQGLGVPVGTSGNSGWQFWSHTLGATGNYRLAFVATNDKDEILDAALFLDNQAGSCDPTCPALPEPATLALLGIGLAGLGLRRRKQ